MTIDEGLLDKEIDKILSRKKPANDLLPNPPNAPLNPSDRIEQSGQNNIINNGVYISSQHRNSVWLFFLFLAFLFCIVFLESYTTLLIH